MKRDTQIDPLMIRGKGALSTAIFQRDVPDFIDPVHFAERAQNTILARTTLKERSMRKLVLRFLNDDCGATAIKYGLIAPGISVAIIVAVNTIGTNLNTTFSSISSPLK